MQWNPTHPLTNGPGRIDGVAALKGFLNKEEDIGAYGIEFFFMRYFGNLNLNVRYRSII